jgi:hypothetical protein
MFEFFKKNDNNCSTKIELVIRVFSLLPANFLSIKKQLNEGILIGCKREKSNYIKFTLKTDILNKYEDKNGNCFEIKGIKVFDKNLNTFIGISLEIAYGVFIGYSTFDVKELNPDIDKIDIRNYWVKSLENSEFENLKTLLSEEELKMINPNDVYELELGGQIYYHLKDIEDGDFIGIDKTKNIFKITHDPCNVIQIKEKLSSALDGCLANNK